MSTAGQNSCAHYTVLLKKHNNNINKLLVLHSIINSCPIPLINVGPFSSESLLFPMWTHIGPLNLLLLVPNKAKLTDNTVDHA